jgi:hypothetical protein
VGGQLHVLAASPPGVRVPVTHLVPLGRRLGEPGTGRGSEEKKIFSFTLSGIEPRSYSPEPSLRTALSRLGFESVFIFK